MRDWTPVLVRPALPSWSCSALADALDKAVVACTGPQERDWGAAERMQRLVFLLDALDELHLDAALGNIAEMVALRKWPQAKLIVTSEHALLRRMIAPPIVARASRVCAAHSASAHDRRRRERSAALWLYLRRAHDPLRSALHEAAGTHRALTSSLVD
jgi:hypothetical protein